MPEPLAEDSIAGAEASGPGAGPAAQDPGYHRTRKPVRVQRGRAALVARWWRRLWKPLLWSLPFLALAAGLYGLVLDSSWFILAGSSQIAVTGAHQTDPAAIQAMFSADYGRNVFFIPLRERQHTIEELPWVASARVLRLWPAELQVVVRERVPVAFVREGSDVGLVDASGVLLRNTQPGHFNFPILTGLAAVSGARPNAPAALAQRAPQMQVYTALEAGLRQARLPGRDISEINLGDLADLRLEVAPAPGQTVLLHLGDRNYAARYQLYLAQINAWRAKYPNLAAVDLRYDGEAIVDPGTPPPAAPAAPAAKPAVKPAAKPKKRGRG